MNSRGQPVEQFGVRGQFAELPEIVRRAAYRAAEMELPESVGDGARGELIVFAGQPFGRALCGGRWSSLRACRGGITGCGKPRITGKSGVTSSPSRLRIAAHENIAWPSDRVRTTAMTRVPLVFDLLFAALFELFLQCVVLQLAFLSTALPTFSGRQILNEVVDRPLLFIDYQSDVDVLAASCLMAMHCNLVFVPTSKASAPRHSNRCASYFDTNPLNCDGQLAIEINLAIFVVMQAQFQVWRDALSVDQFAQPDVVACSTPSGSCAGRAVECRIRIRLPSKSQCCNSATSIRRCLVSAECTATSVHPCVRPATGRPLSSRSPAAVLLPGDLKRSAHFGLRSLYLFHQFFFARILRTGFSLVVFTSAARASSNRT